MAVMTAQAPLPLTPAEAVVIGEVVALVEETDGSGRVYVRGELTHLWGPGDETGRRLAAVQLAAVKAATGAAVAVGFGIGRETLRLWMRTAENAGTAGLIPARPGPKGPSKLTPATVADIRTRRSAGGSLRAIAHAVGVSTDSVRRALLDQPSPSESPAADQDAVTAPSALAVQDAVAVQDAQAVVLGEPAVRTGERSAARAGRLQAAEPVFTPAGRVPLAGLLLALPGLDATGLLSCAQDVYGRLPDGFYGLSTMLLEGVFRALAGQPRVEGAARFAPTDLGRVLGMDRAPEVKTIRRKIAQLATQGKAADLLAGMAAHHLNRPTLSPDSNGDRDGGGADGRGEVGVVLYVDGHVRAYTGTKKIAKTHSARLRFPAPATVETWVSDAAGDPVLVVMATPGASLAGEIRALLPDLRAAVGDQRQVLVGFDRGGWSPALFAHLHAHGFDVLTWRKGTAPDLAAHQFTDVTFTDDTGRQHTWTLADTPVQLPLARETTGQPETFAMRQITRLDTTKGLTRQVHILTTRTDLPPAQIVHRMGSRWRQENYFRYARMHLGLDSHDSYAASPDDPDRSVPNPTKRTAHRQVQAAYARAEREKARAQAGLLAARTPAPGQHRTTITNQGYNAITGPWHAAEDDLNAARTAHAQVPTRVRLGDLAPDQQVLDTETKLIHHALKIAAFNTTTAIARDIRLHTNYARAAHEAYTLTRQTLTHPGDILPDPAAGTLTIRLDPLPTTRETAAVAELCAHLTATATTYPGTDLVLRYEIKTRP